MRAQLAAETTVVAAGIGIAVALLAWPLPIDPSHHLVGASLNDHHSVAWTLDFVAEELAAGRLPWGHTARIEWPDGATLAPADLPEAIVLAPLTLVFGAAPVHSLLAILHHALTAGLSWGWLRREGAESAGAAAGTLAVAFAPALVAATFDGNPDATPWYWIPAALWCAATPGAKRALGAGGLAALGGACNPYVGVMAGLALLVRLGVARRWRDLGLCGVVVLGAGLAVTGAITASLHAQDAAILKGPRVDLVGTASPLGLVDPRPTILHTDPHWALPVAASGTYLGWSLLVVAAFARERVAVGWVLVAVGAVAALGPELRLGGASIDLPWALVERLPGVGRLHLTGRFTGLAALGLAWLATRATPRLGRWRWVVPVVVALDLLAVARGAVLLRSGPTWDDGSCALLADLGEGPVVDLPPTHHELWLWTSLCHRRPVAEGINRPLPRSLRHLLERTGPTGAGRILHEQGFRWLVHHRTLPHPDLADLPAALAPCQVVETDAVAVYDLECGAALTPVGATTTPPPRPAPTGAPAAAPARWNTAPE